VSTPISSSTSSSGGTSSSSTSNVNAATASLSANQQLIQQLLNSQSQPQISFGGLVSGLNTQAIVQAMMAQAQLPIIELQNQQAMEQAKLQAWQDLNTKIQTLQQAASTLGLQSTVGAKSVTLSGPSGTFATATASSDAVNGNFTLQIDQLATSTKVQSTSGIGTPIDGTDIVTDSSKLSQNVTPGSFTISTKDSGGTVTTHQITVTDGEDLNAVLSDITATTGNVDATIGGANTNQIQLSTTDGSTILLGSQGDTSTFLSVMKLLGQPAGTSITSSGPVGVANSTAKLDQANINGLTSYNTATDALQDVLDRINASSAGVTASYDPNTDTVSIVSNNTGNIDVSLADGNGNLLQSLNVDTEASHTIGQSARYEVNGGPAQYSLTNTVNNLLPGVNATFTAPTPAGEPLQGTVALDTSTAESAIQSFVTAYNAVVDTISQDTAYNATTKQAGIFLGDPTIGDIQNQLDTGLFISNGQSLGLAAGFTDISVLGLSTGPVGSQPGTTTDLQFDPTAFEAAMAKNAGAATKLATTVFKNFSQLTLNITQPFGVIDSAIQSETNQITDFQNEIDDQNQLLQQQQTILNNEFANLETTLAQLQSQSGAAAASLTALTAQQAAATASTGASTSAAASSSASSGTGSSAG
jgi:flagellar hook-associated protein 2